jgi:hypothetical protein
MYQVAPWMIDDGRWSMAVSWFRRLGDDRQNLTACLQHGPKHFIAGIPNACRPTDAPSV